ncbi:MAG: redoxin domain-containing protein, partial [Bacteroidetes bacterium]|nr:redoxin domain-containing protein [Bacteroidota bacterium]
LKFIEKHELAFDLLADTEKKMYGRTYMGVIRSTFVIDEEGKIEDIIEKVKVKDHTAQILK